MIARILRNFGFHKVDTHLTCGRVFLRVNGYYVAMQGDLCRDAKVDNREPYIMADDPTFYERHSPRAWDVAGFQQVLSGEHPKHRPPGAPERPQEARTAEAGQRVENDPGASDAPSGAPESRVSEDPTP